MNILAVDTCFGRCSVAILQDGQPSGLLIEETPWKQAETIVPMIVELLRKSCTDYKKIQLIAVTIGPGSFTGTRIGLAAVKGISMASKIKLVGITSTEAIAFAFLRKNKVSGQELQVLIDARRGQYYSQSFFIGSDVPSAIDKISMLDIDDVKNSKNRTIVCNSEIESGNFFSNFTFTAEDVALLASKKSFQDSEFINISPLYIRPPDAKLPKQKHA